MKLDMIMPLQATPPLCF